MLAKSLKFKNLHLVVDFINNNYSENYHIDHYAEMCNLDKYYFIKLFKEFTGDSPQLYRTKIRIDKAKELLTTTRMTCTEISEALGYQSPYYFSRIFKNHTGVCPSYYRKQG